MPRQYWQVSEASGSQTRSSQHWEFTMQAWPGSEQFRVLQMSAGLHTDPEQHEAQEQSYP
jgi:hypothetical protein